MGPWHAIDLVYVLLVGQGLFLVVLLGTRRANRAASRLLASAIAALALSALYTLYLRSELFKDHPSWLFAIDTFQAFYGPAFYLYTWALTRGTPGARAVVVHLLPFLGWTLVSLPRLALPGPDKLHLFLDEQQRGTHPLQLAFELGAELQGLAYFVAAIGVERRHRQRTAHTFSNTDRARLGWLRGFLYALAMLWVGSMLAWVAPFPILPAVHTGMMGVFYAIAYRSAAERPLPVADDAGQSVPPEPPAPAQDDARAQAHVQPPADTELHTKYQKSRLPPDELEDIAERLRALFARTEPFRDPELTLGALAASLGVSTHALSQVLNERFGKSFHDYVNLARVEAMKTALMSSAASQDKILAVGLACGFSSKSTMNNNFKKHTGVTPSQFRGAVLGTETDTAR